MPGPREAGVFARVAAAFVAPAAGAASEGSAGSLAVPVAPTPPRLAVLCRPSDALALGGAVALGLRRGGGPAVLCLWRGGAERDAPVASAPALPGALRLAERLGERGHVARATGRLVLVALDEAGEGGVAAVAAEAVRVGAACPAVPVVCVFAGPRDGSFDRLLLAQDRVLVAVAPDDPPTLTDIALDGLAALGARGEPVAVPAAAGPARALASAGVALLPPLRSAVECVG